MNSHAAPSSTCSRRVNWERIVPGEDDGGRAPSVVDTNADWDLLVDKYHEAPNSNRTPSVVDQKADWEHEVEAYWAPDEKNDDGEPEVVDDPEFEEDLEEMQERYWQSGTTALDEISTKKQDEAHKFMLRLAELGVKVVVFEMDNSASRMSTGGIIRRDQIDGYIAQISPDFQWIVPMLLRNGFSVALTSSSNHGEEEQQDDIYLTGKPFMEAFLTGAFGETVMQRFRLLSCAYDNDGNGNQEESKNVLQAIQSEFPDFEVGQIVVFDSNLENVRQIREGGFRVFRTNPRVGFEYNDALKDAPLNLNGLLTHDDLEDSEADF